MHGSRCVPSSIPNCCAGEQCDELRATSFEQTDGSQPAARSPKLTFLYPDPVPELPEVETIVRGLDKRISGDTIESVWIGSRKQPLKSSAAKIVSMLEGKRVLRVHRAGKHIVFDLEGSTPKQKKTRQATSLPMGAQWIVHLGMAGRLVVSEP